MAAIGFLFFKRWFQFCNIVLLGNGGVSFLIGLSAGGEAERKYKKMQHFRFLPVVTCSYTGSFSLSGVFIPNFLFNPRHSPVAQMRLGL